MMLRRARAWTQASAPVPASEVPWLSGTSGPFLLRPAASGHERLAGFIATPERSERSVICREPRARSPLPAVQATRP
ncbi:hypothetical protein VTN02DRAFT_2068 [Thermoascus thermophilus]